MGLSLPIGEMGPVGHAQNREHWGLRKNTHSPARRAKQRQKHTKGTSIYLTTNLLGKHASQAHRLPEGNVLHISPGVTSLKTASIYAVETNATVRYLLNTERCRLKPDRFV